MARPKTKSTLVEGISELVESLRSIESKLNTLIKSSKSQKASGGKRGRPVGSGKKRKPGRPAGSKKRGRPPGSVKAKPGRPAKRRGRGRPPGSKNKK